MKNSINLIYTDDEHPIAFSKDRIFNTYISSSFFEKNKEKFKEYELKKLQKALNEKSVYISFPNIIFNDEILKLIINSNVGNSSITCYEVDNKCYKILNSTIGIVFLLMRELRIETDTCGIKG